MINLNIPSQLLLELAGRYGGDSPALVLGGEAALANAIGGDVVFAPTDVRERDAARVPIEMHPAPESAQRVLIPAPPDRDLLRRQLLVAAVSTDPGGRILICGANAAGGKSAIRDAAELLGTPTWSGYREKHRMAIFTRQNLLAPRWADEPGIAPGTWRDFTISTPIGEIPLQTQAGVFAGAKLDAGTRLLLEHLRVEPGAHVLDIGCGAGIIGIVAARMGAGSITMSDANLLAIETATRNAATLGIQAEVIASDVSDHLGDDTYDLIVSNPPFHRGKHVDFSVANRIITGAAARLRPNGSLLLVANAFLAYHKQMAQVLDHVETVAATPQYHVLRGEMK